jgi:hypothetical protein
MRPSHPKDKMNIHLATERNCLRGNFQLPLPLNFDAIAPQERTSVFVIAIALVVTHKRGVWNDLKNGKPTKSRG